MSNLVIPFTVLSIFLGGVAYFVSDNFMIAGAVALIFVLLFFVFVAPNIAKFKIRQQKRHECYLFVNSFLITLSVCQSLEKSYELATQNAQKNFKATLDSIALMEAKERIEYLSTYFEMPIYDMFLSVLNIYLDQGGDILALSKTLMEELTRIEETAMSISKNAAGVLIQWIVLWAMSIAILAFVRFGLDTFYDMLKTSTSYLIMTISYFVLLAVSIAIFTTQYTGEKLITISTKKKVRKAS